MCAHSDWVQCLETDQDKKELYSGGKDGVVKVWKIQSSKLKCMAGLSSNSGAVNCLTKIDKGFGRMFVQGSADRSIRMWKYKEKVVEESEGGGSPGMDRMEYGEMNNDEGDGEEEVFE
jgi:WD40 repeat protein